MEILSVVESDSADKAKSANQLFSEVRAKLNELLSQQQ